MPKAVLILDEMPEKCDKCKLQAAFQDSAFAPVYKWCVVTSDMESDAKNCPLRPMVERKEYTEMEKHPTVEEEGIVHDVCLYKMGWNAAIDALEGHD